MLDQLVMGVISGVVASACFMLFLFTVRPNIKISAELCEDPNNKSLYRIKVVNRSRVVLNDVHYSLHYCEDAGDGIRVIEEIEPKKTRMTFLDKYDKTCEDYAVRLSYEIDSNKYPLDEAFLEFNIMACHSLSNTMSCVKKIYSKRDIKAGFFETGKSMRIILNKTGAAQRPSTAAKT